MVAVCVNVLNQVIDGLLLDLRCRRSVQRQGEDLRRLPAVSVEAGRFVPAFLKTVGFFLSELSLCLYCPELIFVK